ncbi:MAG: hypothetical protein DRI92_06595 [Aquificota bacterium]|nr:MAG: hypothetical protein DRI92_06595 [Aquificota bacterium]
MCASANACLTAWDFGDGNPARSSRTLTPRLSEHIKKLRRLAAKKDLDVWFEDECHFQQHGSRCIMWVPPEDIDPVVLHAPTRKSVAVFGAVCANDGRLVTRREKTFNAETFQLFLRQLVRHRRKGRKMTVILDNARWHHATLLTSWLHEHRDVTRRASTRGKRPPYSPSPNQAEVMSRSGCAG